MILQINTQYRKKKDLPPKRGLNYSSMVVYDDKSDLQTRNVINIRHNVIYYLLNSPRLFPDISVWNLQDLTVERRVLAWTRMWWPLINWVSATNHIRLDDSHYSSCQHSQIDNQEFVWSSRLWWLLWFSGQGDFDRGGGGAGGDGDGDGVVDYCRTPQTVFSVCLLWLWNPQSCAQYKL